MSPSMGRGRFFAGVLVILLSGVLTAGCGGGDSGGPSGADVSPAPEPAPFSRSELIGQGDAVCAELNAAVGSIVNSTTLSESDKAKRVGVLYAGLAARLDRLGTPADAEPPDRVIEALRQLAKSADGPGDATAFREAARAYGFTTCAEGPSAPAVQETAPASPDGTGTSPAATPAQESAGDGSAPPSGTGGVTAASEGGSEGSGAGTGADGGSGAAGNAGSGTGGIGPG